MRILVITQYFYPEDFRINDVCVELVRRGHSVTVLTGLPNYPEGTIYHGYENAFLSLDNYKGIKIIRCKIRPRYKGKLNLLFNYLSFVVKANAAIKKISDDFDIVYVYQLSPITSAIPGIKYKKKHKIPLVFYVCDIWPASALEKDETKLSTRINPIYMFAKSISKSIYKKADALITKCEDFIDYLVNICKVERNKCFSVPEHAEKNYLLVNPKPENNKIVDFMFLGNFGKSSNCCQIIESASRIKGNFLIHFVGDGSDYPNMVRLVDELGLNNVVIFHGRHPQDEIIDFYNLADVCLLTLACDSATGFTPPAKLVGYMAACRPIIASINGSAERIINDARCGVVCPSGDIDGLASLMQKVIDEPSILHNMGQNGRDYFINHYTLEKHIDSIVPILEKAVL